MWRLLVAQEIIFELVHTGIGKHQCGIVLYYYGSGGNDSMSLGNEIIEKMLPYVKTRHPVQWLFVIDFIDYPDICAVPAKIRTGLKLQLRVLFTVISFQRLLQHEKN